MTSTRKFIVSLLICTSLLGGCKNPFESKDKGIEKLNEIEKRWNDANRLASATSRIALPTPIANLQNIKNELDAVEVSECLTPAKKALYEAIDLNIDSFLMFMRNDGNGTDYLLKSLESDKKLFQYMDLKYKCTGKKKPEVSAEATSSASEAMSAASEATAAASEATAAASSH
ncbi:hypothetical protein [Acinetobacter sp. ANC 4640]